MSRLFFLMLGHVLLGLGLIGIPLPILPTAPFLILACVCYGRSSKKLQTRLLRNRSLRDWHEHRAISRRAKCMAVGMLMFAIAYAVISVPILAVKIVLVIIAIGVACYIATRPLPPADDAQSDAATPKG